MDLMHQEVMVPFRELKRLTQRLARIQAVTSVLQRVRRLQYTSRKLRGLLQDKAVAELDTRELSRAVFVLVDIENILHAAASAADRRCVALSVSLSILCAWLTHTPLPCHSLQCRPAPVSRLVWHCASAVRDAVGAPSWS